MSTSKYRATHKEQIKESSRRHRASNGCLSWAKYLEQRRGGIPNKETLRLLYFDQRLSIPEIAKAFSVTRQAVHRWLVDYGIHRRTASEAKLNYHAKNPGVMAGPRGPNWKGGRIISSLGYVFLLKPSHPKATSTGYVLEHRVIAENALGKTLPDEAVVHHFNGDGYDNRRSNLVICENDSYHKLLHRRTKRNSSVNPAC